MHPLDIPALLHRPHPQYRVSCAPIACYLDALPVLIVEALAQMYNEEMPFEEDQEFISPALVSSGVPLGKNTPGCADKSSSATATRSLRSASSISETQTPFIALESDTCLSKQAASSMWLRVIYESAARPQNRLGFLSGLLMKEVPEIHSCSVSIAATSTRTAKE